MTDDLNALADRCEAVLAGLTEAQRASVVRLLPGENLMGGYGVDSGVPGLIERVGVHHPIFGSHYRLTPLGLAVRARLAAQQEGQR